ncbi:hypothetical protein [Thiolapillus sp.]|uniref:hypothetical protein n=1 Tax=Thiolapillus sp. TaxID=2017437 RepID=UPI0025F97771|nr:hypothetical protein [Thiolapillus sp.]
MKKIITIAAIAILGTTTAAWAHDEHFGGNEDMYGSNLTDHSKGAPTGEVMKGKGDLYGSHMANPEDIAANPNAKPEMPNGKEALHEQDPEGYGIK